MARNTIVDPILNPPQQWSKNAVRARRPKMMDTPPSSDKRIPIEYSRWQGQGRVKGIELVSHSNGTTTTGICNTFKFANGNGEIHGPGGEIEQRHLCGIVNGTRGMECSHSTGHRTRSVGGIASEIAAEKVNHQRFGPQPGGSQSWPAAGPTRAAHSTSGDAAKMEVTGGSKGFLCGGNFGIGAREIILAGGNISLGSSGQSGLSAAADLTVGSQQGCLHAYGAGFALAASAGPCSIHAYGQMSLYTSTQPIIISSQMGGGKVYINSVPPETPTMIVQQTGQTGQPELPPAIPLMDS